MATTSGCLTAQTQLLLIVLTESSGLSHIVSSMCIQQWHCSKKTRPSSRVIPLNKTGHQILLRYCSSVVSIIFWNICAVRPTFVVVHKKTRKRNRNEQIWNNERQRTHLFTFAECDAAGQIKVKFTQEVYSQQWPAEQQNCELTFLTTACFTSALRFTVNMYEYKGEAALNFCYQQTIL